MAEEIPDDGLPHAFVWTTPKHDRFIRVSSGDLTRASAIKRLRDNPPPELGDATHVTLAVDATKYTPIQPLAEVRVKYTPQEEIRNLLGPLMGTEIRMPSR